MFSHRVPGFGVLFASLIVTSAWTEEASAQPRRVKTKGQVVSVAGNLITMVDSGKNRHQVKPKAESPLIEVSGPWNAADIAAGMIVRLTGTLKANEVEDEVSELVLHSPADGYQLGIAQDAADQPATILGQFVRIKDGKLTIAIGKRRINARLAKEAAITVESKDLRFVKAGDAIEIDAYTTNSGILSGRTIKVTLQPPKEPGDKQPGKGTKKSATKRAADSTEASKDPATLTEGNEGNEGCEAGQKHEY